MGISRWGQRVEKALAEPAIEQAKPESLSISEAISREARRVEIEQESAQMIDWATRRLRGHFPGIVVSCWYVDNYSWYVLRGDFRLQDGNTISAEVKIRDEDIAEEAVSVARWSHFLDARVGLIQGYLRQEITKRGLTDLNTMLRPGLRMSTDGKVVGSEFVTGMRATGDALANLGPNMAEAAEKMRKLQQLESATAALEVKEALNSIKQTIADQQKRSEL